MKSQQEAVLNSLLKNKKTESFVILYHSEWCPYCEKILARAEEWVKEAGDELLYVVSSWELPHVFSAFSVNSTPTVVEVANGRVSVHVEYPKVYDFFANAKDPVPARRGSRPRKGSRRPR